MASGESASADIPKDDDFTAVRNFIRDPGRHGYALSATLRGFSGRQMPDAIPPDGELPRLLATRDFVEIRPGTVIADAHQAACYQFHKNGCPPPLSGTLYAPVVPGNPLPFAVPLTSI